MKELTDEEIEEECNRKLICFCPKMNIIRSEVAKTPEYLRRYFMELGGKNGR